MEILKGKETKGKAKEPIVETARDVSFLGVKLPKAENRTGQFVPDIAKYSDYIYDPFSLQLQRDFAVSFLQGDPLLIEGGSSIGKTTTARLMAARLGWEVHYANLNGTTDVEDLMGRYIPNANKKTTNDPEFIFADGKVTSGLRQEEGKIKLIILDELNAAAPNILIRLHEVLDALERGENVILSEDAAETIAVNKAQTKIIGLMNPPGKGYFGREPLDPAQLRRWVYKKAPSELPSGTFSHATDVLFQLAEPMQAVGAQEFLTSRDTPLTLAQLEEIPGMSEVLKMYKTFHGSAKNIVQERVIARDQPQPFSYDDRMEPRRVRDFILRFYNGDISDTMQQAVRYYYAGKIESETDKAKLNEMIQHIVYKPDTTKSKRIGLADMRKSENGKKKDEPASGTSDISVTPEPEPAEHTIPSSRTRTEITLLSDIKGSGKSELPTARYHSAFEKAMEMVIEEKKLERPTLSSELYSDSIPAAFLDEEDDRPMAAPLIASFAPDPEPESIVEEKTESDEFDARALMGVDKEPVSRAKRGRLQTLKDAMIDGLLTEKELMSQEKKAWKRVLGTDVDIAPLPDYISPEVRKKLKNLGLYMRYIPSLDLGTLKDLQTKEPLDYLADLQKKYPKWRRFESLKRNEKENHWGVYRNLEQNFWFQVQMERITFPSSKGHWVAVELIKKPGSDKAYKDSPLTERLLIPDRKEQSYNHIMERISKKEDMILKEVGLAGHGKLGMLEVLEYNLLANRETWGESFGSEWTATEEKEHFGYHVTSGSKVNDRGAAEYQAWNPSSGWSVVGFRLAIHFK